MNTDRPNTGTNEWADTDLMPALFLGHGSPMNAIEDNEFSRAWRAAGESLPRPKAILCISAHWETHGTDVTAMETPETIHDSYGFPDQLYRMHYRAPGSPGLARLVQETIHKTSIRLDSEWGLDHGAWSVLSRLFPNADVPVVQLSLDRTKGPEFHYGLGRELRALRNKGVLIVGSGNLVHNLGLVAWEDTAYDWAIEFDAKMKQWIVAGDHDPIIYYSRLGHIARLAVPTNEHYLPLLYALAVQDPGEPVSFFTDIVTMGSISMRSLRIG